MTDDSRNIGKHHDFVECDACNSKAGMPSLCGVCYHNRSAVEWHERRAESLTKKLAAIKSILDL